MREMVYTAKRLEPPERIAEGTYKGFTYYVLNVGTYPCAYIDVTDTNLHGVNFIQIEIDCHGGLTYSKEYLATVDKKGWFIGWDYAHLVDFTGDEMELPEYMQLNGKKWSTAEIVKECKEVIDQIVNITKDSNKKWRKMKMIDRETYCKDCDRSIYATGGFSRSCDVNIEDNGYYNLAGEKCYCKIVNGKRAEKYPWETNNQNEKGGESDA